MSNRKVFHNAESLISAPPIYTGVKWQFIYLVLPVKFRRVLLLCERPVMPTVNDVDRLGHNPAMRWIVGGKAAERQAASTSQMGRFETELMASDENFATLTVNVSGRESS